ncbi:MAG: shikimate dehydrogenase family protein [Aeoliella sp.]
MSSLLLNEKCGFLADTVAGDPTHYMFEQALAQAELDWRFLSFEVPTDQLATALAGLEVLGFRGVKLADAFCLEAAKTLASLTDRARRAGSANCLLMQADQLTGDDTYGAAFIEAVGGSEAIADKQVVVIGSGQKARSIASAAEAEAQVVPMTTENNKAHVPEGASVVVFAPDFDEAPRPVIDSDAAGEPITFVDTRLRGSRTGLLKTAAERGATVIDGVDLTAREAALTLELWTGLEFDRAPLRELAEEYLGV